MKQLTQKLKSGRLNLLEVPIPSLKKGEVILRNYFSLVSAGTERSTVQTARKGYIGKARERPQQVKRAIEVLKSKGPVQTYRAVMRKLDTHSPMGYSCVGEVIEVGPGVAVYSKGDLVACGGLSACHAEIVRVPVNLCAKLNPDTDMKQAAYNTVGAIAMQGVRNADLRLGEICGVVGLGLIGQLTGLLLRASGIRTIGVDIDAKMVKIAKKRCMDLALARSKSGVDEEILQFTGGIGCDAVIITAASDSLDPINFAGTIARKCGTVVIVGDVPTGFDREPHYYKKELQLKMSCSYGPGRYDPQYEQKGIDYPPAYVRWTEKRNMEAFQNLIYTKQIDVSNLTTHTFKLEEAPKAYDMILEKSEPYLGILIQYDANKKIENEPIFLYPKPKVQRSRVEKIRIGFIGAGSYAQSHLLPNLPKSADATLKGVMTSSGTSSRFVAERFGFEFCTGDEKDIIENAEINTVFIATHHHSHASYALKALKAGKHVFLEKPLCSNEVELGQIVKQLNSQIGSKESNNEDTNQTINESTNQPILMNGYNRRFSPFAKLIEEKFGKGPMAMTYRVNAGVVPADSWIQDPEFGGGRIIGEVCHFVDFLTFLNGSMPVSVHANVLNDPNALNDTLNISLNYENGSIGTISYFANGDKSLPKERVEVYACGCTAIIEDFKSLTIYAGGKRSKKKLISQDKGQKNEIRVFIDAVRGGEEPPIPYDELFSTSLVTFKILESIRTGQSVKI